MKYFTRSVWLCLALMLAIAFSFPEEALAKPRKNISQSVNKKAVANKSKTKTKSKKTKRKESRAARVNNSAFTNEGKFAALVVDADTGRVLYEKNAGAIRYPASLTKMMTLYLTFDALKKGKLNLDEALPVSAKAARQPQTNISLDEGDRLEVRTAIESLVVRSANDASMVLAEGLGGTEWNFALMMTKKARELGMKNTVFRNPNGLPDDKQYTTAYDMARLGIALRRDFPEYYPYFKLKSFSYNGITYPGHNRVLNKLGGADGIKTGYIRASGFNLVTSVKRDGHRLVGVIMGGESAGSRDAQMVSMLERTFADLQEQGANRKRLANNAQRSEVMPEEIEKLPPTPANEENPAPLKVAKGGEI